MEGFTPRCAVCKDSHTAWSNACPARRTELKRVEQAKNARSIYWHVPLKDSPSQKEPSETATASAPRRSGRLAPERPTGQTRSEQLPVAGPGGSDSREKASENTEGFLEPPVALEATTVQIIVTPPTGEEHILSNQPPQHPQQSLSDDPESRPIEDQVTQLAMDDELLQSVYPDEGLEGMQAADTWLANLANPNDNDWLNAFVEVGEAGPSPVTSAATDTRTAQGTIYKGCRCPDHQEIYSNWPSKDAELTISRCMNVCVYCGKDYPGAGAAELRKHVRKKHGNNNITVTVDGGGRAGSTTPSWIRKEPTGASNSRQTGTRTTRKRAHASSITVTSSL